MKLEDFKRIYHEPPHDRNIWVLVRAHIINNKTGLIRTGDDSEIWDEENNCPHTFIWEEGNYSCDCNRSIFFDRFGNEEKDQDAEPDPYPCGHGKYNVNLENPVTGEIFYKEF